jgi:RNAse (barnase) inhibitor barstar
MKEKNEYLGVTHRISSHVKNDSIMVGTIKDPPQIVLLNPKTRDIELKDVLHGNLTAPLDIGSFERFCVKQRSAEELKFWKVIQIWKAVEGTRCFEKYAQIMNDFVLDTAVDQVNLPGKIFKDLEKKLDTFNDLNADEILNVFDESEQEVFTLMRVSVFPLFLNRVIVDRQLSYSKTLALWWKQSDLTISSFFTFPDAINIAESRIHAFCSGFIVLSILVLSLTQRYLSIAVDYDAEIRLSITVLASYLCYGFLARASCGPRLDIQAFIVLFLIRPFLEDILGWIHSEFEDAKTARWLAQVVGGFCAMLASSLLLASLYLELDDAFFFAGIALFAVMLCVTTFSSLGNFCIVCWSYYKFKNLNHPKSNMREVKIYYIDQSEMANRDA